MLDSEGNIFSEVRLNCEGLSPGESCLKPVLKTNSQKMATKCGLLLAIFGFLTQIYNVHPFPESTTLSPEKCAELHDIDKMIPLNDILNDILAANHYDPEVKEAFNHLASPQFKALTERLEGREEYKSFMKFCKDNNLKIPEAFTFLKGVLPALVKQSDRESFPGVKPEEIVGGIHGLIMRIFDSRLPMKEIRTCFNERIACDPKFKEKVENLRSLEFKKLLNKLRETQEYKEVVDDLEEYKIYFNVYLNVMLSYFDINQ